MPDYLLLRFRDFDPQRSTVGEHDRIVAEHGKALWGWWKKASEVSPDPGLTMFKSDLVPGQEKLLLIDSGTRILYKAPLFNVHYEPIAPQISAPTPELCPDYYRNKGLPAWFEIGQVEEIGPLEEDGASRSAGKGMCYLNEFVWSRNNRTSSIPSASAVSESQLGQDVVDFDFLDSNVTLWLLTPKDDIGLSGRSSQVQAISRAPWPVRGTCALHISDLHFGEKHAFRNELATRRGPRIAKESLAEAILDDLLVAQVKPDNICLLLVTGDFTWTGDPHEFENALEFVKKLCRELGLHPLQVVVVPGNHDIEWRHGKEEVDENAELNYRNFCKSLYAAPPNESLLRLHQFVISGRRVSVAGLNSCRIESRHNAGLGFVGKEQLAEVSRALGTPSENELRIALLHHHLKPVNFVEDIDWETKRLSLTIDAEAVVRSLMGLKFQLVLHGHQHQPFFSEERRSISESFVRTLDGKIAIVGGGSAGVERGHLNLIGQNTYNLIELGDVAKLTFRTRMRNPLGPGFVDHGTFEFFL